MEQGTLFIICVVLTAYVFDFINGFHDAANSIATIVTTKVLTPLQAVLWASLFNFIAFLFFKMAVAHTIGTELINPAIIDIPLIFSALLSAIFWGLLTWYFAMPSSSSQALIGGLAGAAIIKGGWITLKWVGLCKIIIGILVTPFLGLIASITVMFIINRILRIRNTKTNQRLLKTLQLISSACLSITHGTNDAQKTMGIITLLLFSCSWLQGPFVVPLWVTITCHLALALGTLTGGWRIVKTMGTEITPLNPVRGCAAETGAALAIMSASIFGVPVSTTQTVAGSIAGVGIFHSARQLNWTTIRHMVLSWLFTIPATALVAAGIMWGIT
ncbi:MAG: inorganic phosphate transporter [Legionellales bacterium]|nr:inorganic phosphate transporter [Legionellales bacterium]